MPPPFAFQPSLPPSGWVPVRSSNVDAVRYDPATHALFVRFKAHPTKAGPGRPRTWRWGGVPPHELAPFLASPSKGRHVAFVIRKRYGRGVEV